MMLLLWINCSSPKREDRSGNDSGEKRTVPAHSIHSLLLTHFPIVNSNRLVDTIRDRNSPDRHGSAWEQIWQNMAALRRSQAKKKKKWTTVKRQPLTAAAAKMEDREYHHYHCGHFPGKWLSVSFSVCWCSWSATNKREEQKRKSLCPTYLWHKRREDDAAAASGEPCSVLFTVKL